MMHFIRVVGQLGENDENTMRLDQQDHGESKATLGAMSCSQATADNSHAQDPLFEVAGNSQLSVTLI